MRASIHACSRLKRQQRSVRGERDPFDLVGYAGGPRRTAGLFLPLVPSSAVCPTRPRPSIFMCLISRRPERSCPPPRPPHPHPGWLGVTAAAGGQARPCRGISANVTQVQQRRHGSSASIFNADRLRSCRPSSKMQLERINTYRMYVLKYRYEPMWYTLRCMCKETGCQVLLPTSCRPQSSISAPNIAASTAQRVDTH